MLSHISSYLSCVCMFYRSKVTLLILTRPASSHLFSWVKYSKSVHSVSSIWRKNVWKKVRLHREVYSGSTIQCMYRSFSQTYRNWTVICSIWYMRTTLSLSRPLKLSERWLVLTMYTYYTPPNCYLSSLYTIDEGWLPETRGWYDSSWLTHGGDCSLSPLFWVFVSLFDLQEITTASDSINRALADRKKEIVKLCGVHHLLKKVRIQLYRCIYVFLFTTYI